MIVLLMNFNLYNKHRQVSDEDLNVKLVLIWNYLNFLVLPYKWISIKNKNYMQSINKIKIIWKNSNFAKLLNQF